MRVLGKRSFFRSGPSSVSGSRSGNWTTNLGRSMCGPNTVTGGHCVSISVSRTRVYIPQLGMILRHFNNLGSATGSRRYCYSSPLPRNGLRVAMTARQNNGLLRLLQRET